MPVRLLALLLALIAGLSLSPAVAQPAPADDNPPLSQRLMVTLLTDPSEALAHANRAINARNGTQVATRNAQLADAYWVRAQATFRLGDRAGSTAALGRVLALAPEGVPGAHLRAHVDMLRGHIARAEGDFGVALQRYRAAQSGYITAGHARGQGLALQAVGMLYADVGDSDNAIRYLDLANEAYHGDEVYNLSLSNNRGVSLQNARRHAEAQPDFTRAATIAERLRIRQYANQIRLNLAISQMATGAVASARQTLATIGPPEGIDNVYLRRDLYRTLAVLALREGRLGNAHRLIDRALAGVDHDHSDFSWRQTHFAAFSIYDALGDNARAIREIKAVRRLDEADAAEVASNRAALLAAQFQFAAQNARIERLNAEQLERSVAFERQRNRMQRITVAITIVGSVLTVGLLTGLLLVTMRSRNRAQRDRLELAQSHSELERALAAKTEFLASTSHEIRTPLNGIIGMTQIMLADPALEPQTRSRLELIGSAGNSMRALVDDILDIAKIEHGGFTISPQPTDVGALVTSVADQFRMPAAADGLDLRHSVAVPPGLALIDPDRLRQILFNLVGNAIKFTRAGHIDLNLSVVANDEGESLRLEVIDTGIGIAPEWHEAIFDLFRQVDGTRTRRYGGTGLGLAICRQLARAMGGDIMIDSTPGEGTRFIVDLPYRPVVEADTAAAPISGVIAVGADPLRRSLLSNIATRSGLAVTAATPDSLDDLLTGPVDPAAVMLIDRRALELVQKYCAPERLGAQRIIIASDGTVDPAQALLVAGKNCQCVAFAVGPILAALNETSPGMTESGEVWPLRARSEPVIPADNHDDVTRKTAGATSRG